MKYSSFITVILLLTLITTNRSQTPTTIQCNDTNNCIGQTLQCEESNDCTISCIGSTSVCKESTILCPAGPYNCTLLCDSTQTKQNNNHCADTIINASQIDGGHLIITVDSGQDIMTNAYILCPSNGNCLINVISALRGIQNITVNASNTISGNLHIISERDADWTAKEMKVYCPINGDCIIDVGNGWGVCHYCTFIAQPSTTLLSITAQGTSALEDVSMTCPMKTGNTKNCIINVQQGNFAVRLIKIKSVESLTNIDLTVSAAASVDTGLPPKVYCMDDYSESCYLERISSTEWQCINTNSPCHNWTPNATKTPTSIPTQSPTQSPSQSPTQNPSQNPTQSPSITTLPPTHDPTVPPSAHTMNPTQTPTYNPSIVPTLIPSLEPFHYPTNISMQRSEATLVVLDDDSYDDDVRESEFSGLLNNTVMLVVICVVLFYICLCGGLVICNKRKASIPIVRKMKSKSQGIQHEIGEQSVSLSGGLEARISVAHYDEGIQMNENVPSNKKTNGLMPDEFVVVGDDEYANVTNTGNINNNTIEMAGRSTEFI